MTIRFYVVPIVSVVQGAGTHRSPKYFGGRLNEPLAGLEGIAWEARDYGPEDVMIVGADVSAAQHLLLAAELDVLAVPEDIESPIGPVALEIVKGALENLSIPAGWVTAANTYREVMHLTLSVFALLQPFLTAGVRLFVGGVTLGTRMNQLPAAARQRLIDSAAAFSLDTSGITNATTIRQAFKIVGDQMPPFIFHGRAV